MNEESRHLGDTIGAGDIASGESLVSLQWGLPLGLPARTMSLNRAETLRASTPEQAPPVLMVTEPSPIYEHHRGHSDGRSSAPIQGSLLAASLPRNLNVLRSWGQLTGRSTSGGGENRIFGELPGTVLDPSPEGKVGRRFYEK